MALNAVLACYGKIILERHLSTAAVLDAPGHSSADNRSANDGPALCRLSWIRLRLATDCIDL
jgi:hypothetical protein